MKMYNLETFDDVCCSCTLYRFYSLYNGIRGAWTTKEKAIEEGECHQKVVLALAGEKETNYGKPRKGYTKAYETEKGWRKEKRSCLIHGFFDWSDRDEAGPVAVIEFDDGTVQVVGAENIVFAEKS